MTSPSALLPSLLQLARDAGSAIMRIYDSPGAIQQKADTSPLTLADLAAHHILIRGLKALTPDIPVVSEEEEDSHAHRKPTGQFWIIDPLDGTKEFIAHNGEFTVNIALVENGFPLLGVVYAPALEALYWSEPGRGAYREQGREKRAIHVAADTAGRALRVVASKSHLDDATRAFINELGPHELVQAGSSLKFCRVAEGSADVYPRLGPTCEWDTAAAQAVVEAAGGSVKKLDASRLNYGKPDKLNPHFVVRGGTTAAN
ncbi:MAG TPA: 3'(2'),5'-bisphosphate nucleotidase CysQ [Kiritimatiellia bacterium]|nr:3'(2'),5'-bisphosphate nucleotidase CysQ [Kiritimatiellia bacterium]